MMLENICGKHRGMETQDLLIQIIQVNTTGNTKFINSQVERTFLITS